jgi:cytochrome c
MPDGKSLVSVGYDLAVRIWPLPDGPPDVITLTSPLNAVAIAPDGEIAAGGADGKVRFLTVGRRRPARFRPVRRRLSRWRCLETGR